MVSTSLPILAAFVHWGGFKWTGSFTTVDLIAASTNALNGALLARRPDHYKQFTIVGILLMALLGDRGRAEGRDRRAPGAGVPSSRPRRPDRWALARGRLERRDAEAVHPRGVVHRNRALDGSRLDPRPLGGRRHVVGGGNRLRRRLHAAHARPLSRLGGATPEGSEGRGHPRRAKAAPRPEAAWKVTARASRPRPAGRGRRGLRDTEWLTGYLQSCWFSPPSQPEPLPVRL